MSNTSDKRTNKIKFSFIGLIIATLIIIILILVFLIFSQNRKKAAPADSGNVIDVISDSIDNAIMGESALPLTARTASGQICTRSLPRPPRKRALQSLPQSSEL